MGHILLPGLSAQPAVVLMNVCSGIGTGDVVYLDALGQPMIILGSHEAAADLLEKRSAIYSDRSISTMAELCVLLFLSFRLACVLAQTRKSRLLCTAECTLHPAFAGADSHGF